MSQPLEDIVFASSDQSRYRSIKKQVKQGTLRKIFPRVYSTNLKDPPAKIVLKNLYIILGQLFPGALLSHRSAFELKPTKDQVIFLTYKYTKKNILPGVTISFIRGPKPVDEDKPFLSGLYISSTPRAYLENMQLSRSRGKGSKSLPKPEIEDKLDSLCRIQGEDELNKLRDDARRISKKLKMAKEFDTFNGIISKILRSRSAKGLSGPAAKARAIGKPYDPDRVELLSMLLSDIQARQLPFRKTQQKRNRQTEIIAFFEAYFSNYIEGTIFELDEARKIIFENIIPKRRPQDAHDIIGTFKLVNSPKVMNELPESADELVSLLQKRHLFMMNERSDVNPGKFKELNNQAGKTIFVKPELVRGTLGKGFEIYRTIDHPLGRAIFMMFMISEVHPFDDGNGRLARIMMNAELVKHGLTRIIIPVVYRDDYLSALRAISRKQNTEPLIKMLDKAQAYTAALDTSTFEVALKMLTATNAFIEPDQGKLLSIPGI